MTIQLYLVLPKTNQPIIYSVNNTNKCDQVQTNNNINNNINPPTINN